MIKLWQIIILFLPVIGMITLLFFVPSPYQMIILTIKIGYSIFTRKYVHEYIKQRRENR